MKKYLIWLICLALPLQADPFSKANRKHSSVEEVVESAGQAPLALEVAQNIQQCEEEQNPVLWADSAFSTLTLVGILQQQEHWQGLFSNGKQVLLVKTGDVLAREFARIESIDKNQLTLSIRQQGSCHLRDALHIQF